MSLHFPEDRLYHKEHLWAKKEADGSVRIGISDFAQDRLSSVIFVDLPAIGAHFAQGESGAELESVKVTSEAIMPMSGKVVEVNAALGDTPELLNSSPYDEGWLVRIIPDDPDEAGLLSAAEYAALVAD
ncbi:Glycine cleavage system H protein [uncultured delta proteobacterium]|uniref:Glycine cleavage system H protein n=1 Tax=uncultured delta proteobacterium TaxID=34034 RepID=A0A212K5Z9_9DELT|nr:Glycine cleavage system H protein [uncultured delta proteobacterium]